MLSKLMIHPVFWPRLFSRNGSHYFADSLLYLVPTSCADSRRTLYPFVLSRCARWSATLTTLCTRQNYESREQFIGHLTGWCHLNESTIQIIQSLQQSKDEVHIAVCSIDRSEVNLGYEPQSKGRTRQITVSYGWISWLALLTSCAAGVSSSRAFLLLDLRGFAALTAFCFSFSSSFS